MPLVYLSDRAARRAARLLPTGVVLETEVSAAILRGDICGGARGGYVFLDTPGLVCRYERKPGRLRERPRSWVIVDLKSHDEEHQPSQRRGARLGERAPRPKPAKEERTDGSPE